MHHVRAAYVGSAPAIGWPDRTRAARIKTNQASTARRRGGDCAAAAIAPTRAPSPSPFAMPAPPLNSLVTPLVRPVYSGTYPANARPVWRPPIASSSGTKKPRPVTRRGPTT